MSNRKQAYLTKLEYIKDKYCGQCAYFVGKCTTSYIEAKFGDSSTPACTEFKEKRDSSNRVG